MVVEFIKSAEGTRYLMPRKGLKVTVQNNDRNLETLSFQSLTPITEPAHMAYLAISHHKCVRVFSVRDELVNDGLRQAMELTILPAICEETRNKRAKGDGSITATVVFENKVYLIPCAITGRFPTSDAAAKFAAEHTALCDLADYPLPEEEEEN